MRSSSPDVRMHVLRRWTPHGVLHGLLPLLLCYTRRKPSENCRSLMHSWGAFRDHMIWILYRKHARRLQKTHRPTDWAYLVHMFRSPTNTSFTSEGPIRRAFEATCSIATNTIPLPTQAPWRLSSLPLYTDGRTCGRQFSQAPRAAGCQTSWHRYRSVQITKHSCFRHHAGHKADCHLRGYPISLREVTLSRAPRTRSTAHPRL
jgi:hypothetical protein